MRPRLGALVWLGAVAAVTAVLATAPSWLSAGRRSDLVGFFTLLALAQMWNLLAGYAGLVSIGQQAFVGIGGYALFILCDKAGIDVFASVALAGVAAGVLALPTAVAFRLRGGYFAIGTWVIAEVVHLLVVNWRYVGAGDGTLIFGAAAVAQSDGVYYWALGVGVGSVLVSYALLRSRLGLGLAAIRDEETAAGTVGVDVLRLKLLVWVVAAAGCGLAGAVVALNGLRVQPDAAFTVDWSAKMIFIVVIGGIGTIEGPIVGTILFTLQQTLASSRGALYLIIVGSIAVLAAVWLRRGVWGTLAARTGLRLFPVRRLAQPRRAAGEPS